MRVLLFVEREATVGSRVRWLVTGETRTVTEVDGDALRLGTLWVRAAHCHLVTLAPPEQGSLPL